MCPQVLIHFWYVVELSLSIVHYGTMIQYCLICVQKCKIANLDMIILVVAGLAYLMIVCMSEFL